MCRVSRLRQQPVAKAVGQSQLQHCSLQFRFLGSRFMWLMFLMMLLMHLILLVVS